MHFLPPEWSNSDRLHPKRCHTGEGRCPSCQGSRPPPGRRRKDATRGKCQVHITRT